MPHTALIREHSGEGWTPLNEMLCFESDLLWVLLFQARTQYISRRWKQLFQVCYDIRDTSVFASSYYFVVDFPDTSNCVSCEMQSRGFCNGPALVRMYLLYKNDNTIDVT